MCSGRAKQVECQDCLWEKQIPFGHQMIGICRAENSDEMILEGTDCSFCCVGAMFFWGHLLESNIVLGKSIFQLLRTFIVENADVRRMTLLN
jgi:hypothetical protein